MLAEHLVMMQYVSAATDVPRHVAGADGPARVGHHGASDATDPSGVARDRGGTLALTSGPTESP